ncbi:MAG TPA: hypothetical protein VJ183_18345 [Chloroflexia bacterium]|nr:hypothetical protein [Chloroflexia bacterium]
MPATVSIAGLLILFTTVWLGSGGRSRQDISGEQPQAKNRHEVATGPRLISGTVLGSVVAANGQLFWMDNRNGEHSIYGYDPDTQKEFLVSAGYNGALTSNGKLVTWLLAPGEDYKLKVQRYDPATRQQETIAFIQVPEFYGKSPEALPMFAADTNIVYYVGLYPNEGLHAIDLATGDDRIIAKEGVDTQNRGPVAGDGILVWPEVSYYPPGPGRFKLPHAKLHALQADGTEVILADEDGCVEGSDVSGSKVVWTLDCQSANTPVHLTDLQSGQTKTLTPNVGGYDGTDNPLISGNLVAWAGTPEAPGATQWSVVTYDITSEVKTTLLTSDKDLYVRAIVDQNTIAYLACCALDPDLENQHLELYMISFK